MEKETFAFSPKKLRVKFLIRCVGEGQMKLDKGERGERGMWSEKERKPIGKFANQSSAKKALKNLTDTRRNLNWYEFLSASLS